MYSVLGGPPGLKNFQPFPLGCGALPPPRPADLGFFEGGRGFYGEGGRHAQQPQPQALLRGHLVPRVWEHPQPSEYEL